MSITCLLARKPSTNPIRARLEQVRARIAAAARDCGRDPESITLLVDSNNAPMVGSFDLSAAEPYVSTRIKMGKTGNVVAVVKSGGKLYANQKEVKVTIGGCGG